MGKEIAVLRLLGHEVELPLKEVGEIEYTSDEISEDILISFSWFFYSVSLITLTQQISVHSTHEKGKIILYT